MTVREQLEAAREEKQQVDNLLEDANTNLLILRERLEDASDEVNVTLEILQRLEWNTKNASPQAILGVLAEFFQNDLGTCIANLQQLQQSEEVQAG